MYFLYQGDSGGPMIIKDNEGTVRLVSKQKFGYY